MSKVARSAAAVQIPALIGQTHAQFHAFMSKIDHVVAPCQWVCGVLARNGVPEEKVTLSRQGVPDSLPISKQAGVRDKQRPLRLAYFGRIDHAKGADLLARAVAAIPNVDVTLDLFAILPAEGSSMRKWLEDFVARDNRMTLRAPVAPDAVQEGMTGYDLIAVPSRWLETGPLVAFEAFAARVPVLGADLGGIAEIVRDGIDGILVRPDDVNAWSKAISRLAANPRVVEDLKRHIRAPRTMDDVSRDMAELYRGLAS
jgi:glycosyltransferase involved in cell wall biosynthesis